jgi:hypothetical protein
MITISIIRSNQNLSKHVARHLILLSRIQNSANTLLAFLLNLNLKRQKHLNFFLTGIAFILNFIILHRKNNLWISAGVNEKRALVQISKER